MTALGACSVSANADDPVAVIPVARLRELMLAEHIVAQIYARGCQNFTQGWGCVRSRVFDSPVGFNSMCDPCRIHLLTEGMKS